jgi:multiple antibiotic resistance protein MarB
MNVTASAALALLVLFSSQTFAEQTPSATQQNNRDAMILPSAHDQSPLISTTWVLAATNPTN